MKEDGEEEEYSSLMLVGEGGVGSCQVDCCSTLLHMMTFSMSFHIWIKQKKIVIFLFCLRIFQLILTYLTHLSHGQS